MQTDRDAQIVAWLAGLGAASAEHVAGRFGMSIHMAYRRLGMLVDDGLLAHRQILYGRPGVYWATRNGLRWQGLGRLRVYQPAPVGFEHTWQVATVAVALHGLLPDWRLMSVREIKLHEIQEGRLIASAELASGEAYRKTHRADLALFSPSGRVVAIEVELSVKGSRELERICRGWAWARNVDHVYYLAAPAATRAVTRAIDAVTADDAITVLALEDVAGVVDRELPKETARQETPPL